MQKPLRLSIACAAVVLLVCAAWWLSRPARAPAAPAKAAAVPVKVIQVASADVPQLVSAIGTVTPLQSVTVRAQVDGILTRLWVKEGQFVEKGQLLASIDDRALRASLDQATAQAAQTRAQLKVAEVDLKRYTELAQDRSIPRQQLDQQQALHDQLQATLQGNEAAAAAARVQLSYTQIRSPLAGRVGIRAVDEGNLLRVSDAQGLFSVTQLDPISVQFALPQAQLPTLQALLRAPEQAAVTAYAGGDINGGEPLAQGRLSLIDNQVSSTTGTVKAKAQFANGGQTLWPGQLVNVRLQTLLRRNALVVPNAVVQRGVNGTYVYRLQGENVESVPVKVVDQAGERTVIDGVAAGDKLVSDGQSRLKPGMRVDVLRDPPPANATTAEAQP
ncbi:efflux RND transporter periplasmic adaptor subunit [Pseudomonas japonica]|uniref:efflux RND transporter periplasmic adaptor subunit n=1 Tax=Pseudomonas japonica TaxID=256466 RepID=UPI0015E2C1BC|nr:efflux RND transporter periplasmic adaptor subunit [Pseudomonas japonica]MBA1289615.1 efflux RND transporter periplasmic adaptor subunit [Pseudomonas japonica]